LLLKNCEFFVALQITNEVLTSVTFDFVTAGIDGRELVDPSIKLTNGTIAEVEQSLSKTATQVGRLSTRATLQSIYFYFQNIEIISNTGKIEEPTTGRSPSRSAKLFFGMQDEFLHAPVE
jgi:hypothetical protein